MTGTPYGGRYNRVNIYNNICSSDNWPTQLLLGRIYKATYPRAENLLMCADYIIQVNI